MEVVRIQQELQERVNTLGGQESILVPTMGALHEGHQALIEQAAEQSGPTIVSIFVNPTQFAEEEDFDEYPRPLDRDLEVAAASGADIVFVPPCEEIYPEGQRAAQATAERISLPALATSPGLEDLIRPHFFAGVCLVVGRLLDMVKPRSCIFGEKDYQQLLVIRKLVQEKRNRFGDILIEASPTIRDSDGLALSSRNVHLTEPQKAIALGIPRALEAAKACSDIDEAQVTMRQVLAEHELDVDYAAIRHAELLSPPNQEGIPLRALVAARVGSIRLIDNCAISFPDRTPKTRNQINDEVDSQ
jgi:pantoate--beta-alanine ligase